MREVTVDAITAVIAGVETALPIEQVREVVDASLTTQPLALRMLSLLRADPTLLTSAAPSMPPPLQRIVAALLGRGARDVRMPCCFSCGQAKPLPFWGDGERICGPCCSHRRLRTCHCVLCGQERAWRATVAGRDYCRGCWRQVLPHALTRVAAAVRDYAGDVDAAGLDRAIEASVGSAPGRTTFALELEAYGPRWFADPAQGTLLFGTLYDALRAAGAPLPARRCGHCGAEAPLTEVLQGRRSCRKCARRARMTACDGCGQLAEIERRQPDGTRLCQRCTNKLADESAECILCGHHRVVGQRTSDGPVCGTCRQLQRTDTCTRCGRHAPCRFAGTDQAICLPCAKTKRQCIRCEQQRPVHSRTERGEPICHGCATPVIETCTDCGRERRVHGRAAGAPYCQHCYAKNPVSFRDCTRCGNHAYLTAARLCDRCTATDKINALFPSALVAADPNIQALRDACLAAEPATILRAFRRKGSTEMLRALLGNPDNINHAALDAMGNHSATRTVRSLLVEHGVLARRDEHLAQLEAWIDNAAAGIADPRDRRAFTQFARWRHLRVLRKRSTPASYGQATSRRWELQMIIDLLVWARTHGTLLAALTQHDVERWLTAGPHNRHRVKAFLQWTHRNGYSKSITIAITHDQTLDATGIDDDARWDLLQAVFADTTAAPGTRLAAALILLYGVRLHRIAALKLSDVTRSDNLIHIRLGSDPLLLPDELGPLAESVARDRTANRMFAAAQDNQWLFPGSIAGYPVSVDALTSRVKALGVSPHLARKTALVSLAMQLPPAIISRLTGLHVNTAARWAEAVAASSAKYAAVRQPKSSG